MEHLDARSSSLTESLATAVPEGADREGAELDRALVRAIRQLISQARDMVDAAPGA
jgi:hypothetical protein